jgi:hypothetical protein
MDLQYQLLKLENAAFVQGQDEKRQSETNFNQFKEDVKDAIPTPSGRAILAEWRQKSQRSCGGFKYEIVDCNQRAAVVDGGGCNRTC